MSNNLQQNVIVSYTNFRGETDNRLIKPLKIWFGTNDFHSQPQWLIDVIDLERNVERTFALNSIHKWTNEGDANFSALPLTKKLK
jgi:hypothetical protein